MSTGFKVNHAADNAANYLIVTNMSTRLNSYQVAEDNVAMGLDMVTTAAESLDLINDKLVRLRALAEQAANGTYGEQSLNAVNAEANALVDEIERTYNNSEYNGIKFFGATNEPDAVSLARAVPQNEFISKVKHRNTSSMTALSSVDASAAISSGTYSISSVAELEKLAEMTNKDKILGGEFVLAGDLDLSSISNWTPIGNATDDSGNPSNPVKTHYFKGTFDGNGYVISNLTANVNSSVYSNNAGLFGNVAEGSEIKNLGLENANADGGATGALVGEILGGNIINCYATGTISGTAAGGLVGRASAVNMTNCFTDVKIPHCQNYTGGLVANISNSNIANCYTKGDIIVPYAYNVAGLVSSRSTLRDADIADVSSEYIRQQILQQASASLLATANQTPALALQLL